MISLRTATAAHILIAALAVTMTLDRTINSHPVNTPAFTADDAAEYHARRIAKKEAEMKARRKETTAGGTFK